MYKSIALDLLEHCTSYLCFPADALGINFLCEIRFANSVFSPRLGSLPDCNKRQRPRRSYKLLLCAAVAVIALNRPFLFAAAALVVRGRI